ncbi:MAG: peroxiredoxin [Rhodospirillales bacterium]
MTIKAGDKFPAVSLKTMGEGGLEDVATADYFKGKKVALFGLPGAYTKTCSAKHLPGFVANADALKAKGIDEIVCVSVNDAFVMNAWGKQHNATGKVKMVGDGNAELAKALGLALDLTAKAMGTRVQRFSMIVDNGVVKELNLEDGDYGKTSAETLLQHLG